MTSFALTLFSCSNDTNVPASAKEKLSVVTTVTRANVTHSEESVIFTGDDIETYNGKTGRIVFRDLTYDDLFRRAENNSRLKFYLGDEFLFDIILVRDPVNTTYSVPILMASRGDEYGAPDKFFLLDGYPLGGRESVLEQNPAWSKFIQYLTDVGKLTEAADPVTPPVQKVPDETISAITTDDIKSYNLSTGEIIFTGFTVQDIHDGRIGIWFGVIDGFYMPFYLGEKLLFEANCVSPLSSIPYHDLTLTWYDDKFYLLDGYPVGKSEEWKQIRDANAQKWKAGWDIFIKYLSDTGKIIR
ncbi:MAG: hypothetical protein LBS46_02105 [Dysgonamonadaceae bacterium]|nr:hypothetical protein [Dysgonamonadaceae bacterium]